MSSQSAGSEITSKIRSAIKAKLMELGSYVDDELPDYIMVMIANKKSKQQMADDLNLFLGKNSNLFTDWLQNVLDRLQSIGRSSSSITTNVVQVVSESVVTTSKEVKTTSATSGSSKSKNRKQSPDRKKKSSPRHRRISEKRNQHRKRGHDSDNEEAISSESDNDDKKKKSAEKKEFHTKETKAEKRRDITSSRGKLIGEKERVSNILPQKSTTVKNSTAHVGDEEDILVVRAELEEGDELAMEQQTSDNSIKHIPPNETKQQQLQRPSLSVGSSAFAVTPPFVSISSTIRKPIEAPSPDVAHKRHVGTVRPMKRKTPSPSEVPSRKRRSTIGQVVQHEEYDPLHPQIGPPVAVPSTVHVTDRKYTVPREMQPKSSIFLRALNEANRSVKVVSRRNIVNEAVPSNQATEQVEHGEREKRNQFTVSAVLKDQRIFGKAVEDATGHEESSSGASKGNRRVQLRQSAAPSNYVPTVSKTEPDNDMEQESLIVGESPATAGNDRIANPRFVVTMSGIDRKFVDRVVVKEEKQSDLIEELDYDDPDTLIVDIDENEFIDDGVEDNVGSSNVTTSNFTNIQTPPTQIVNPVTISLEDDEDDDDINEKDIDTIVVSTDSPVVSNESAVGSPRVIDDTTVPPIDRSAAGEKILERCRYWPNCKLEATCQYLHPTAPCKNFPHCRFGDNCLYIHPPCKFNTFCKNPSCPFAHNRTPVAPTAPIFTAQTRMPIAQGSFIPCKFGGWCENVACPFRHPKTPCMYGSTCTKPNCAYSHRPLAPTGLFQPKFASYQHPNPATAKRAPAAVKSDPAKFRWTAPPSIVSGVVGSTATSKADMSNEKIGGAVTTDKSSLQ